MNNEQSLNGYINGYKPLGNIILTIPLITNHANYDQPKVIPLYCQACSVKKTLHCLEAIHMSQSGTLLTLLIDKFLHTNHLAVARLCDMIACRRVEMLLAESVEVKLFL